MALRLGLAWMDQHLPAPRPGLGLGGGLAKSKEGRTGRDGSVACWRGGVGVLAMNDEGEGRDMTADSVLWFTTRSDTVPACVDSTKGACRV